jgi:hypothetical protein
MKMSIDPDISDIIQIASCTLETRSKALRFVVALRKTIDLVFRPVPVEKPKVSG